MGGAVAMLAAAVEPEAVGGLMLTCSVFPWARGGAPHPVILTAFAAYRSPVAGEWLVRPPVRGRRRGARGAAEHADGRRGPQHRAGRADRPDGGGDRGRREDPDAGPAFLDAARSMLRLGRRPAVAARAMDDVRCPVLVLHGGRDRLVPVAFAEAALRAHPAWRGRIFRDLGHVPQIEAPGRWLAAVADWAADL